MSGIKKDKVTVRQAVLPIRALFHHLRMFFLLALAVAVIVVSRFDNATIRTVRASVLEVVTPVLSAMFTSLHETLQASGFALDTRPFRPHVTLARRCVQPHPRAHCAPIRWRVDRLCLIGSELRPEGPIYTELESWRLPVAGT